MKAIMVQERNGIYDICPNAEPEEWADVTAQAVKIERIDRDLRGWGMWETAYRVHFDTWSIGYFVERREWYDPMDSLEDAFLGLVKRGCEYNLTMGDLVTIFGHAVTEYERRE